MPRKTFQRTYPKTPGWLQQFKKSYPKFVQEVQSGTYGYMVTLQLGYKRGGRADGEHAIRGASRNEIENASFEVCACEDCVTFRVANKLKGRVS